MHFRHRILIAPLVLALVTASADSLSAQSMAADRATAREKTDPLQPVTPADYGQWEQLRTAAISPDGRWLAVPIDRVNEENELRIRRIDQDSLIVIPYGSQPSFSNDKQWLAYRIGMSEKDRKSLEDQQKPVRFKMGLLNLSTGDTISVDEVAGFRFNHDGTYIAMSRHSPNGQRDAKGADLVIRTLASATDMNFGNVSQFAWQDEGSLLALIVDAEGKAGNGVRIFDPATGVLRSLESESARYTEPVWREVEDDLAFLRVELDSAYEDSSHTVIAWRGLEERNPQRFEFDPTQFDGFPDTTRIVDYRGLRWSDDGQTLFFGIKDRRLKEDAGTPEDSTEVDGGNEEAEADEADKADDEDEERAGVEVWHAKDVDIVPTQKVLAGSDRKENYLSAWHLDRESFVQLGNELTEAAVLVEGDVYAIGFDETPYDRERMFGPRYQDVYRIDIASGERERIVDRVEFHFGASSGGRYFLFFRDDQYWTVDLLSGTPTNITEDIATSFVNNDRDITVEQKPPFGRAGWSKNDETVLLYDKYDVWEVRPDGSQATRLTRGAEDSLRYRYQSLDWSEDYIDTDQPIYLTAYGEWSKQFGYTRVRSGRPAENLVLTDARVTRLQKADSADVFVFITQRFDDSPDYFATGPTLADPKQVTETNTFQKDYAWGHADLIEYENTWGIKLQGSLFYPAGYEPGKQYPMIVYIYEKVSQTVHTYSVPSERRPYNVAAFTAEGYFVLRPDIVYRDRDPGRSAVAAIEPAVHAAIETGMIDADRVGLVGHSWGGYETAFTVTQSDLFTAAVAGAPLTNLFSMYLSVYWNSGGTDARIFEISQGRMEVPFWEDVEAYAANSPVFHIDNMNTPLLVTFGTEDGAVDFNQGVEFYNAARRADKDFVLLVYEGENHGLAEKANQLDYHRRIIEWFGHYLKDDPAPDWIKKGVPYLEQERNRKN